MIEKPKVLSSTVYPKLLAARLEKPFEMAMPFRKFSLGDDNGIIVLNCSICGKQNELVRALHLP